MLGPALVCGTRGESAELITVRVASGPLNSPMHMPIAASPILGDTALVSVSEE